MFNSRFAKARISSFCKSEVLNSSFVHLMKFSTKIPRLLRRKPLAATLETLIQLSNYIKCIFQSLYKNFQQSKYYKPTKSLIISFNSLSKNKNFK